MSESGGGNAGDLQSNCAPNPLKGAKHIKIMGLKSHSGGAVSFKSYFASFLAGATSKGAKLFSPPKNTP